MVSFSIALLAAGLAAPARAEDCEGILAPIRQEISREFRMELSCGQLAAAARALPVEAVSPALGTWGYAGELAIRDKLWREHQIRFSTAVLPLGLLEREPPQGQGPGLLLVFGLEMPRRSWGLLAIAQQDEAVPTARAAKALAEGAVYDWLGVYRRDPKGALSREGRWLRLESGGAWSSKVKAAAGAAADLAPVAPIGETRACASCLGWLCPPEPIACFADFNLNDREELLLIDDCRPHACGLRLLEEDPKGRMEVLFDVPGVYGQWTRRTDGWVLVSEVYCPWGEFCGEGTASLGNPNCERPEVYRFSPKSLSQNPTGGEANAAETSRGARSAAHLKGAPATSNEGAGQRRSPQPRSGFGIGSKSLSPDPALREQYYPVEDKRAPAGCEVDDPKGALVYAPDGRFVRYFPR
ncbi:MAG: hypothetical protein HY554_02670 [Elusimicrobia bacterium]|nr:hypothetical protein [Elusimicrobiota bacterium]